MAGQNPAMFLGSRSTQNPLVDGNLKGLSPLQGCGSVVCRIADNPQPRADLAKDRGARSQPVGITGMDIFGFASNSEIRYAMPTI